jgi:hypothetical protein
VCRLRRSSADSVSNQLGGLERELRGVFGAGHVCRMGPPDQIPPATTVLQGIQATLLPTGSGRCGILPGNA